jgi:class 3 adenylate cyclase
MSLSAPGDIRKIDLLVCAAQNRGRFNRVLLAADSVAKDRSDVRFEFHRARPPLAELSFEDLSPSRSVRMGMASLFADIDGFTAYIDGAIQAGGKAISNAVRDIHVLREELNSVLKEDFGGKRVRFIGDCIHGVIAEGSQRDDAEASVKEAVLCASGMRSSFSLARDILGTIDSLDLAIGVEYGQVPLTRLGCRGTESVRCAAGLAVVLSEKLQQSLQGGGIVLGEEAKEHADSTARNYFEKHTELMEFANAADYFGSITSPVVQVLRHDEGARPHAFIR